MDHMMNPYFARHPIKTEPVSPDADLFAVYLKDLMIHDYGELNELAPQPAPSQPYIEITEQPKQRDHRFRYPVEGRQAGSITGEKSSSDLPSYPALKVHNLTGRAKVVVSLVTKDDPPRPHPHRLVGDHCNDGVCTVIIDARNPEAIFRKIGVQRTMNKEVEKSLEERKRAHVRLPMDVNKGKTGKKSNYDMKCVRLFFEVSLETPESPGIFNQYLTPIKSTPIYDKKDTVLTICRVNIRSGTVAGGDELFILCEKVQSDDIKVLFTGVDPATHKPWSEYAIFGQSDVHRQFAVVCKTPRFVNQNINAAATVSFKLYRPSDEESSNEMEFTYKPLETTYGRDELEKKKRKITHKGEGNYSRFFTSQGKPLKTETLGASAQSCSGAPISNPVSTAPSTLTFTPTTSDVHVASASSTVKENLRQRIMKNKDGGSRPSTPSSVSYSGGTAQPTDSLHPTPVTYSSDVIMCTGRLIQQQPVSTDQGQLQLPGHYDETLATTVLLSQATNQHPVQLALEGQEASGGEGIDEERQSSEQFIKAIADQLMKGSDAQLDMQTLYLEGAAAATATPVFENSNVVVEQLPDIQFNFDGRMMDMAALQEMLTTSNLDLVYTNPDETAMDIGNSSNNNVDPS